MQVRVKGLDELARELRRVDPRLVKELQKAHKAISTRIAGKASTAVAGLPGPRTGEAAGGVRPRAGQKKASLVLLASNPYVRAAVMGTNIHWVFGRPVPAASMMRRVWQPWVGNDWSAEEGLYGVSPVIAEAIPGILDTYADSIIDALKPAFPD